jgi:hypothetical protein
MGYSGHKHRKGEKVISLSDDGGNIIAPLTTAAVNVNDSELLPDAFGTLEYAAERRGSL